MLRASATMVFDPFTRFTPQDFVFKIARTHEELEGFWSLRKQIFCEEQNLFQGSDRDQFDEHAIPIICETLIAGMEDSVVGVVRIDERAPQVWHGSRLGVAPEFRSVKRISPGVALRNHQPIYRGLGALGAGLIYKAVSTAHALGCREFLATVQHQNARFFQRLHWEPLGELELFGLPHVKMRADLDYYRPAECVY
ncbi:MAG TPA: MSMEG_0567/Sll0786 family nitrogen starvation N-acetyltransferase [Chthoniobacterales bacterium]|nr:MSMEG_0567/Sll0786 family nitrogen starvation N-acetyltransferase [Chthoniobacterales bacterium]